MRKIKLLGLVVCVMLICLIIISSKNNNTINNQNRNNNVNLQKENIEEVINNGKSALQYNGYLYYVKRTISPESGYNNKLCRRNLENNEEEILYDANQYKIEDRLMIFNNNIFFSMIGQTYYINLENTNHIKEYNKGILYSIGDGKLIYEYNNNLYKGTYYVKTLAINSITPIAEVSSNCIFEDDQNIYFYRDNLDYSKSIISINKENQTVKVIDEIYREKMENIYSLKLNGKNISLYKNDEVLVALQRSVEKEISNTVIEEFEDYIFVRLELGYEEDREIMLWKVLKDGTNVEKLN